MRAGTPSAQSKSHVLAGVQDAYWSDDEAVSEIAKNSRVDDYSQGLTGGYRVSSLSRGDGYFRHKL